MEFPASPRKRIILPIPTALKQGMVTFAGNTTQQLKISSWCCKTLVQIVSDWVTRQPELPIMSWFLSGLPSHRGRQVQQRFTIGRKESIQGQHKSAAERGSPASHVTHQCYPGPSPQFTPLDTWGVPCGHLTEKENFWAQFRWVSWVHVSVSHGCWHSVEAGKSMFGTQMIHWGIAWHFFDDKRTSTASKAWKEHGSWKVRTLRNESLSHSTKPATYVDQQRC